MINLVKNHYKVFNVDENINNFYSHSPIPERLFNDSFEDACNKLHENEVQKNAKNLKDKVKLINMLMELVIRNTEISKNALYNAFGVMMMYQWKNQDVTIKNDTNKQPLK